MAGQTTLAQLNDLLNKAELQGVSIIRKMTEPDHFAASFDSFRKYIDEIDKFYVLVDLVESLLSGGFRRIVVLNGHGGNITPGKQAMVMLSNRHDDALQPNIAFATYWELGGVAFKGQPPMETCSRA